MKRIVKKVWTCTEHDAAIPNMCVSEQCTKRYRKRVGCRPVTVTITAGHGKGEGK
jgi:hypothetical protein